ncbi:MAG TPA: DUF6690 family protein [Pirellulales bacterium]
MFRKTVTAAGVFGAAIGVPYVASNWSQLKANVFGTGAPNSSAGSYQPISASGYSAVPELPALSPAGVPLGSGLNPKADETPIIEMTEAFRWEVTPQSVMSHWPRVSSGLPGENLQGMRVALISGLRMDDVAGSLTYYFTAAQKCAKITFSGTTGDPSRLVGLLVDRYGFKPVGSTDPGVMRYEIRWMGDAHSWLIIRPSAIVRSSSPYARYEVQASINDPAVK